MQMCLLFHMHMEKSVHANVFVFFHMHMEKSGQANVFVFSYAYEKNQFMQMCLFFHMHMQLCLFEATGPMGTSWLLTSGSRNQEFGLVHSGDNLTGQDPPVDPVAFVDSNRLESTGNGSFNRNEEKNINFREFFFPSVLDQEMFHFYRNRSFQ